jgi:hypothetical protein
MLCHDIIPTPLDAVAQTVVARQPRQGSVGRVNQKITPTPTQKKSKKSQKTKQS